MNMYYREFFISDMWQTVAGFSADLMLINVLLT